MNPDLTAEALQAAPLGSIIRRGEHVIAVKARVGSPWLRIGDNPEWSSSADMATIYRGPHDRLVWPADTTPAQRMGAHLDAAVAAIPDEPAELSDDASTVGQWATLDERERHELIRAMPLERVEQLGAVWARAQDAAALTVEQARGLRRMLGDVLHGTAEAVGL